MWLYAVYGRSELGNVQNDDVRCLWVFQNPKRTPAPINFAEDLIDYMIELRDKRPREKILCGGMITILTKHFIPHIDLSSHTHLPDPITLDISQLVQLHFLKVGGGLDRHIYQVNDRPYTYLPDLANTSLDRQVENPFWIQRTIGEGEQPRQPMVERPSEVPLQQHAGEGSSSTPNASMFDFSALQNQLSYMQSQIQSNNYYNRRVFDFHVERGDIRPPVNYPYDPPQSGPIPGWNNNTETFPYWSQGTISNQPGYDYRRPGGCDPSSDPNIPPFYGGVPPPGYHDSIPPMDQVTHWGASPVPPPLNIHNRPNYNWTPYTDVEPPSQWVGYNTNPSMPPYESDEE